MLFSIGVHRDRVHFSTLVHSFGSMNLSVCRHWHQPLCKLLQSETLRWWALQRGQTPRLCLCTKSWVWRSVWGETFTHGSVRGWRWNSLALLAPDLWPAAKIQLWLAQTKNNVWSIESVQSDGIMDIKICWFLEIYCVIWKIFFIFPAQMD